MANIDLSLLDSSLEEYSQLGQSGLLPALHAAQDIYGYLPEEVSERIAQVLKIPLADVYGVIDFYALFYRKKVGQTVVHVCNDPACSIAGADGIFKRITQTTSTQHGRDDVTVFHAPCLGLCEFAPAIQVDGAPKAIRYWKDLVIDQSKHLQTRVVGEVTILTDQCRPGYTAWIDEYVNCGGYDALRKALTMTPEDIIDEVKKSGLVGRGGAAFPTGIKWESTASVAADAKYIVCNADEAEPGAFKDRVMLEHNPHRILEGLIIGAYAIGAKEAYIYIRGEYEFPARVMQRALQEARLEGYIGNNILSSDFSIDVHIRRGAGAYICGEETAQFESIEGKRGYPRIKPPYPTVHGLFGKPTIVNNVETLCNIPFIIIDRAEEYRKLGTEKSPGTKLFCLSGDVKKPGLYEVPMGIPFRHLLFDLAGGMREDRQMQAALIGGAAGTFATAKDFDVKLSFEHLREAGLSLGAGVITVFDETRDMYDVLLRLANFFTEESCGKCFPCQLGTQRQYEIISRYASGKNLPGDDERLRRIGQYMTDSSLCGLGQTASSAVTSAMQRFPKLF